MPPSMPRQKRHAMPLKPSDYERIRWLAKRRLHAHFPRIRQSLHRIQSAAADNSNVYRIAMLRPISAALFFRHVNPPAPARLQIDRRVAANMADGTFASCVKIASASVRAISGIQRFLFSSVCIGYRSYPMIHGKGT